MRFKTSSINKELLVYIFRSSGWVSILYVMALLFALPLEVLMTVMEERVQYYSDMQSLLSIHGDMQYVFILVIPVLLAVFLFRFLQVKPLSDLIHSLPVSRKQVYVHHVVAGIIFLLLPILLTAFILLVFLWTMDVSQLYTLKDIGLWVSITFTVELLIFSATVFMGMITGLSALQAVLTYVLLLLPVGLLVLFVMNMKFLLFGFSESYYLQSNIFKLSPVTAITDFNTVKLLTTEMFVYLLLAVGLLFLSFLLYKKRKHEYVSHAFAFPVIRPVFKYGMTTGVMLFSGYYFSETTERFGWLLFGYAIGVVLGYLLAEMVLQKTWRTKLRLKGFGYYVLVVMVFAFVIKFDFIGFESRVPDSSTIKKVYISNALSNYHDDSVPEVFTRLTEVSNIKTLRNLHEQIIEHGEDERVASNGKNPSVSLMYELENGRKVSREYHLRNYEAFSAYLKKIYESQEYKERFYSLLNISPADVYQVQISGSGNIDKSVQLREPKEIKKAMEALQTDLSNQTYEEMTQTEGEYGYISITMENNRNISLSWTSALQRFNEWMEQTGKADQARIQVDDISYMIVQEYDSRTDYYNQDFVPEKNALKIENVDQKNELLDRMKSGVEGKYVVLLYDKGGNNMDIRGLSDVHVPEFIQEHFNN